MKKLMAFGFVLLCVFALAGCSNQEEKVWDWAQNLSREDIISVTPRCEDAWASDYALDPLDDAEIHELVALLNELTKDNFTENKDLRGITPTFGIQIEFASETYHINEANAPDGALEMRFHEKQWWIDSEKLMEFVQNVTDNAPSE